jgi:hypothetical protein
MPPRKRTRKSKDEPMKMVRKPIAPPGKVEEARTKYRREREKARLRRIEEPE